MIVYTSSGRMNKGGGPIIMQEGLSKERAGNSPMRSFVSGVILRSLLMREVFSQLVDYEKVFVRWLLNPILETIAGEISHKIEEGSLLDIGCGPGDLLFQIHERNPGIRLTGVDISRAKIHQARKRMNGTSPDRVCFMLNRPTEIPFRENTFQYAISTFSFHIWNKPVELLNEIYRVLDEGCELTIYNFNGGGSHARDNIEYFKKCVERAPLLVRKIITHEAQYGFGREGYHYYSPDEARQIIEKSLFQEAEISTRGVLDSGDHFLMEARMVKKGSPTSAVPPPSSGRREA
jgi:ubiquinone/menaquinone biosynthesis C-methylase UbiE